MTVDRTTTVGVPVASLLRQPTSVLLDRDRDGRLLIGCNAPGTQQLFELAVGDLHQVTFFDEPVTGRYLPGTRVAVVAKDSGGNERFQLLTVDLQTGKVAPITDDPAHVHEIADVSHDGRLLAFLTNRRNPIDFDVVVRDMSTGEETNVYTDGGWCRAARFSPDGRRLAIQRLGDRPLEMHLLLADLATGDVTPLGVADTPTLHLDPAWVSNTRLISSTDRAGDKRSVCVYDVEAAAWETISASRWDSTAFPSEDGDNLLVVDNVDGASHATVSAATLDRTHEVPLPGLGVMTATPPIVAADDVYFTWTSPRHSGDVWHCALATGTLRQLTSGRDAVPTESLIEPELHRVEAADGESIPTWIYRPVDVSQPPAAFWIHGGPESQSMATFNPLVQALATAGIAVVVPNVRGSTGYGRRYASLDDTTRRLDAVADLAALHDWLPTVDIDASRAALMGGSYGGYLTLAGLAFQPERWTAGVDIVGISNLVTFLENTAGFRRRFRETEYGSLQHDREFLEYASPLTHAKNIRAPLLIVHGANDSRVPLSEAEQLADELHGRGIRCELLVYPDEGHGLNKLQNRLDAYPKIIDR
jgi:dipeptidyl aminopeptidase/acylaminoacyl peptidase